MNERRKFVRIPIHKQIRLKFKDKEQFISNYVQDISLGGMYIKSNNPLPLGTIFNFEFEIGNDFPLISGSCMVVRNDKENDAAGMGIKFLSLDPGSEKLIAILLKNQLESS